MIHQTLSRFAQVFALLAFCSLLAAQDPVLVYPQLAVGGGFEVVLVASNAGDQPWNGVAVAPAFGAGSGVAWSVNGEDLSGSDRFPISLPARATGRFVVSAPEGAPAVAGSLEIRAAEGSSTDFLASSFFYDYSVGGELVDSVGTPPARPAFHVVFPVERDPASRVNTGMALRRLAQNEASPAGTGEAEPMFRATLYDSDGALVAEAFESEPGARFFDQLFAAALSPDQPFLGSMAIESEQAFYLTALRQRMLGQGRFQLTGTPALIPEEDAPAASFSARYRVTFQATWSAAAHPDQFPVSAHFSGLVGGVHDSRANFWAPGQTASVGIERMAEQGSQGPLSQEVQQAVAAGTAGATLLGGGIGLSPGQVALEFSINQRHSLVTLVSMVAPSPDWFVGVDSLSLYRNGAWVQELTVSLYPFDAGTDSGTTYLSPDADTQPRGVIREITGPPFANQGIVQPLGTFRFERIG